ncbi:MAG: NADH-quinone oxidoreductase subunit J [candidate division KSB1 bacterium]|nr:NADH-quinone oxidoreductase subunit J [candidate division KSB1 bacterium]MDZ7303618.1 NADH-quinone oxidoreductase subunit J [candidate division KSB1 bacterium]MDZ7312855.1 NADH-quinone oxidoreductase subunit J [candidate division KSB1 bacterium]
MAINLHTILFSLFAVVGLLAALLMILHRNPVYSAIFLIVTLFALAGFYVLLNAPFVAAVHIIVYAGAIMVLFLFVIMLLNLKRDPLRERGRMARRTIATVLVLILMVEIGVLIGASFFTTSSEAAGAAVGLAAADSAAVGSTTNIGRQLFTTYLLPFEIASLLLLVGIVGAVILAKRKLTT